MMMLRFGSMFLVLLTVAASVSADDPIAASFERELVEQVLPLITAHCLPCHDAETKEAELDLTRFRQLRDVAASHQAWEKILQRVEAAEMPPEDAESQPSDQQRQALAQWIRRFRQFEAERNAGDPGDVAARRLSNAEYDYSIRDLTGVDIRPTKTFPIDPANEAGFDNSGESLTMSTALMTKYLQAARTVVDHLLLTPRGIRFAPHPVATDTDRDKYCVKRIVAFYLRQPTDYADYFHAAWIYRNRHALGQSEATLGEIARRQSVSPKYLSMIWQALNEQSADIGPLARLQAMWNELPNAVRQSDAARQSDARAACTAMRDYVVRARRQFEPHFDNLNIEGVHKGTQAFVLWKNKQYAAHRRRADFACFDADREVDGDGEADDGGDETPQEYDYIVEPPDPADRQRMMAACQEFCSLFPDAFYISERGRDYLGKPREEQEKGRLLSAGFHSMMGYFRDDGPLQELILDEAGRRELDELWRELDFITSAPMRQYQGFLWFDRTDSRFMRDPEFDFARPEDQSALGESMIKRLAEVYLAKAVRSGGEGAAIEAIENYFREINGQIRWVEQARIEAEPYHLDAVIDFAERAFRRPLTSLEAEELRGFYRTLRETEELTHDEAIADLVVSVLISPHFCYRTDLIRDSDEPRPLDGIELATRLSYFLWSSLPDNELLQQAQQGDLHRRDVLLGQVRRMLGDDRIRALATEFGGNWLDFRRFESHNSVDRQRFPEFDDDLRSAMFEEPIRFIVDLLQRDRSALDFLYADRTYVNAALAEHYGIDQLSLQQGEWVEVDGADRYGRGGLLPMAVFLTQNSPGLRTSPVKRGYWVVRRLLGERIPPPPPDVPELPEDEAELGELTLRQVLARHRDHPSCAGCHQRFDSLGLVFEGYGPVGERREHDLAGRPIDAQATFPDGSQRDDVAELRRYLRDQREGEFVDNLCRKLLSFALGRTLLLSDESLVERMKSELKADQYRFSSLIEAIVTSPQFLNKRGRTTP